MSGQEIPPWLREQLARFEQLQQNLQAIVAQKQQVEMESNEIDKALSELRKVQPEEKVFKSAGPVLVRVNKDDALKELEEKKELINTRVLVLGKQESRIRESVKEIQAKIDEMVKGRQPPTAS